MPVAFAINSRHYTECVEKRGLAADWILINCRSLTIAEATELLGYRAQSAGLWLEGRNYQGQFKPDKPWKKEGSEKKAPKYRSPLGDYDAMLPTHPEDLKYWDDLEALKEKAYKIDGHPCLVLTEGFFKAIAGCSNNIPTIALLGVEMGMTPASADVQGKRYLVPTLEKLAKAGFGFIIAFDADCATNQNVLWAQLKLAQQLQLFKVPVYSITGLWDIDDGKGMDDFIKNQGPNRFIREVMGKAVDITAWEAQFQSVSSEEGRKKPKPPKPAAIANFLTERYRKQLAWNAEAGCWYRYEAEYPGVWSVEHDRAIGAMIQAELDTRKDTVDNYDWNYVKSIAGLMSERLLVRRWNRRTGLIPLQDGVLDLATMELREHSPGFYLTWQLPYRWADRTLGCQPISDWLLEALKGDLQMVQVLRAYLNAVVKRRVDLQRFLECLGPGGTGKGTFMRLAMALVGKQNTHSTKLKELETNRFEGAAIYDKLLLLITDAERYGGEVSQLKAITGQDLIRYEAKGKQHGNQDFIPECMVIVAANEAVQSGDYTSGLERRRLTVPFTHKVESHQRRDLEAEFKPYLPGLLEWVLAMADDEVTRLVRDTSTSVRSLAVMKAETLLNTNPIAEWLDYCIVHNPSAKTYVGVAKRDKDNDSPNTYQNVNSWLYANYVEYTTAVGNRAVSQRRFSEMLLDLCVAQLKLVDVKRGRDNRGSYFTGLIIRTDDDTAPRPITGNPSSDGSVMLSKLVSDESVMSQTRTSDGSDGCDGLIQSISELNFIRDAEIKNIQVDIGADPPPLSQPITNQSQSAIEPSSPSITNNHQPFTSHHNPSQSAVESSPASITNPQPSTTHHNPSQSAIASPKSENMAPRACKLNRRDGSSIELPAEYPGTRGHNQTKEPKEIAALLRTITCKADWEAIVNKYGELRAFWVWRWQFTKSERSALKAIMSGQIEQGRLNL